MLVSRDFVRKTGELLGVDPEIAFRFVSSVLLTESEKMKNSIHYSWGEVEQCKDAARLCVGMREAFLHDDFEEEQDE